MKFSLTERHVDGFSRMALFIIFFWFGFLKVIGVSPAHDLVVALTEVTLPFLRPEVFLVILGLIEMTIGLLFLFKKLTRYALPVLLLHMIATFGPLVFLPELSWQAPFVPTLVGQYILKNIALVALSLAIYADAVHVKRKH